MQDSGWVLSAILQAMSSESLIDQRSHGKEDNAHRTYGIKVDDILISKSVCRLRCPRCKHSIVVPKHKVNLFEGLGCLSMRCLGHYEQAQKHDRQEFYRAFYSTGTVERIFAHEHTGLLNRSEREQLETAFKSTKERRPDAINLLSCTPTLEMGIDVGDLSATMTTGLPSTSSHFQQQIGRAGRASGSALIVAMATSRPRDLLYLDEPLELIAGHIEPPACFLDAPDILKRQVLARIFDRNLPNLSAGGNVRVQDLAKERQDCREDGFFGNFARLLQSDGRIILEEFRSYCEHTGISDESWADIEVELGTSTSMSVPNILLRLHNVFDDFNQKSTRLRARRTVVRQELAPFRQREYRALSDDEKVRFDVLRREDATLTAELDALGERDGFFGFLARKGLLPNYAFSEDSVDLVGVILRPAPSDSDKDVAKTVIEIDRPAKMAIREFAPGSTFYGGGHKMEIDQIDVGSKEKPLVEQWRCCPACGHLERNAEEKTPSGCPECASAEWRDTSAVVEMLRLRKALSYGFQSESQVMDDNEDREVHAFWTRSFFQVPKDITRKTWECVADDFAFGIEFVPRMDLREINFGRKEPILTDRIRIAGQDFPRGFRVCRECGRIEEMEKGEPKIKHTAYCSRSKKRTTPGGDSRDTRERPIMLYRENTSEAIRIHLPFSDFQAAERVASIKAALLIGFRKKFGGTPMHLEVGQETKLDVAGGTTQRALVMFDSVPGGTGFLREIWDKDRFIGMAEQALESLKSCTCAKDMQRDGCIRCVLGVVRQSEIPLVSRNYAISFLEKLVEHRDQFQEVDKLSVASFAGVHESELEERFASILTRLREEHFEAILNKAQIDIIEAPVAINPGETAVLKIAPRGHADQVREYNVSCQRALNSENSTIADFYFEPIGGGKPIAVFLDGFRWHAGPESGDRLRSDIEKRLDLINGQGVEKQHTVWSLTWDDIVSFEKTPGERPAKYLGLTGEQSELFNDNAMVQLFRILVGQSAGGGLKGLFRNFKQTALTEFLQDSEGRGFGIENSIFSEGGLLKKDDVAQILVWANKSTSVGLIGTKSKSLMGCVCWDGRDRDRLSLEYHDDWTELLHTSNVLQLMTTFLFVLVNQ